jgi:hypothetical protein
MELQVIDPVSRAPLPATGVGGKLVTSLPANAMAITPDDNKILDPPVTVWVGDAGAVNVTVVPYGREGDKSVQYPATLGMTLPVLCKQVKAAGTTATILRGQW